MSIRFKVKIELNIVLEDNDNKITIASIICHVFLHFLSHFSNYE